jgi:signal transduction histidine kinase
MSVPSPVGVARPLLSPVGVTAVSGVIAVGVGVLALRERPDPMAWPLAILMFGIAAWSLPSTAANVLSEPRLVVRSVQFQYVGVAVAPVAYLFVALRYAGHEQWFRHHVYAAAGAVPALTVVFAWTNGWHSLIWEVETASAGSVAELSLQSGPWFWVTLTYSYVVVVAGLFVLANAALGADLLHRRQSGLMFAGGLVPLVANVAVMADIAPATETGLTVPALTVSGLTFAVALFRYDFLARSPAAYRNVSRIFDDGVLVFDEDCQLVDANDHAERILGQSLPSGTPAGDIFETALGNLDGTVLSQSDGGQQFYRVRHEPLTDQQDRVAGHVVVMREVTELKEHEQRLEVANRILRHNLRNELNVILGQAARLEASRPEASDPLVSIQEAAERLNDLGRKARHLQTSLTWEEDAHRPVDLADIVRTIASDYRDAYPGATVVVDAPETAFVRAPDAGVVKTVVANLVENGLEHSDGAPRVEIVVRIETGTVTLRVADDGPGIPPGEVEVLEQDAETDLEHGSGIGLWLVRWFVSSMGGNIEFQRAGGTVVEVTLVRADDAPAANAREGDPTLAEL